MIKIIPFANSVAFVIGNFAIDVDHRSDTVRFWDHVDDADWICCSVEDLNSIVKNNESSFEEIVRKVEQWQQNLR